jgi:hypothetical protein
MFRTAAAVVVILLGVAGSADAQAKPTPQKPAPPKPTQPSPAPPAPARPRPPQPIERVFVSVDGAYQSGGDDFGERVTFVENAENGTFSADYDVKSGPALNVSVGANIWRYLGVGIGVTRYSKSTPVAFSASVPHPFFFNRARSVSGDISDLDREELAVHVQARGTFAPTRSVQVIVFGGPSFFTVKQGVVNDFEVTETYPYDTATFNRALSTTVDESKVGFNVGGDVGYFFTRQVGVGGSVQWAATTIDAPASNATGTFEIKAGGVQAGVGVRFRF